METKTIKIDEDTIKFIDDVLREYIIKYIEDNYEGEFDEDSIDEAISYLGEFYDEDMDDDAIIDMANDLQVEYYSSEFVDIDELLEKATELYME